MKAAKLYLLHITECIARIESYTADGLSAFISSTLIQDAVVRNLQTLAESVKHLSDDVRAMRPEIQWTQIAGFRNVLVHDYLGLDLGIIWDVIQSDIPVLKSAIEDILVSLSTVSEDPFEGLTPETAHADLDDGIDNPMGNEAW